LISLVAKENGFRWPPKEKLFLSGVSTLPFQPPETPTTKRHNRDQPAPMTTANPHHDISQAFNDRG
jgi:hypothetical protein